ncbi:MAG: hypothetical protein WBA46_09185, partial [Thermomicrobiales bacterium]
MRVQAAPLTSATASPSPSITLAPPTRPELTLPRRTGIARTRLVEALDAVAGRRLVMLTAPAGWGKTNAVTEWAHQTSHRVVWCALDASMTSAPVLLGQIVRAFAGALHGPFDDLATICRTATTPDGNRLVAMLVEGCRTFDRDLTLVLDDLDYEGAGVDALLDVLLDGLPDCVHLIITSRMVYPRPVARLRLRGEIAEFGIDDLRFQADDVDRFWADLPAVRLPEPERARTLELTEGWPGGLGLMAIAMSGPEHPSSVLRGFTGAHREAAAYLAEEVFNHLPSHMKRFFVGAAMLDRFSADACDAIFQTQGSRDLIASLVTCNPFLIPLDSQGEWYRFHRMFGEFLRAQVAYCPSNPQVAHLRASRWLAEHGEVEAALPHAVASGDSGAVLDLLEAIAQRPTFHPDLSQTYLATA